MKSANEIVELAANAKLKAGPVYAQRREVRDLWGGDLVVPLPELSAGERAATANLARQGIDGIAQRIGSTTSDIQWHVKRAGFKLHEEAARRKRQVSLGWLEASGASLIRLQRARHLWAYGESPVQIRWRRWDRREQRGNIPEWHVPDPLACFTAPAKRANDVTPEWAVFCYTMPLGQVRRRWPDAWAALDVGEIRDDAVPVEVVEYTDGDEIVLVAAGRRAESWDHFVDELARGYRGVELERVENPAHRCTVVVPGLIGLTDDHRSRINGMVGKYLKAARLDALQSIAIERGIFPRQWLVARPNEVPKIIEVGNPREGRPGIVTGGVLDVQQLNPGYKTDSALADLERAQRSEGGVPSIFSGEAFSGARTARMSDTVEGGALDFAMAELQQLLAVSEKAELEIAADLARAYGGNVSVSMYVSAKGSAGEVSYKASELFADPCGGGVTVRYPMAGADLNQQIQRTSMKLQVGLISEQTARERDPEVEDAELERDRITAEGVEKALLASIQSGAADPHGPYTPDQLARIAELVRTNRMELFEAVATVQREAQEAQAAAPPPVPEGMAAAPETMPGLGAPSQPAPATPPDLGSLAGLLSGAVQSPGAAPAAA